MTPGPLVPQRARGFRSLLAEMFATARRQPALARLNLQAEGEATVALIEAWSEVCTILSFYQERIADEGYWTCAVEPRSVRHLGAAIGQHQHPATAAETYLSLQVAPPVKRVDRVTIHAGQPLVVQNMPPAGALPVVFESAGTAEARAAWNAMALAVPDIEHPAMLCSASRSLRVTGTTTGIRAGQALLITLADPAAARWLVTIDGVQIDRVAGATLVTWRDPIEPRAAPWTDRIAALTLFEQAAGLYGRGAPAWDRVDESVRRRIGVRQGGILRFESDRWRDPNRDAAVPPPEGVHTLAAGPDGTLFASTRTGLFRSDDGGGHWRALALPPGRHDVRALHLAGARLYAGTAAGLVLMSSDAGASWAALSREVEVAGSGLRAGVRRVLGGAEDESTGRGRWTLDTAIRCIFEGPAAGTAAPALFVGTDQGVFAMAVNDRAWEPVNTGLPGLVAASGAADVIVHALATIGSGKLVAATAQGVYVAAATLPVGAWQRRDPPFATGGITCLARDSGGLTLFAGSARGVFATHDFSLWVGYNRGLPTDPAGAPPAVHALVIHGARIVAATDAGLFVSATDGAGWLPVDSEELTLFIADIVLADGLAAGTVSAALRARFARFGITLAETVTVSDVPQATMPRAWLLREAAGGRTFGLYADAASGLRVTEWLATIAAPEISLAVAGDRLFAALPHGAVRNGDWPAMVCQGDALTLDHKIAAPPIDSDILVALPSGPPVATPLGYVVQGSETVTSKAFGRSALATRIAIDGDAALATIDPRTAIAYCGSRALAPYSASRPLHEPPCGATITLAGAYPDLAPGQVLHLTGPRPAAILASPDAGLAPGPPIANCPAAAARALDAATIPPALVAALATVAIRPSATARVIVIVPGSAWALRDGDQAWRIDGATTADLGIAAIPIFEVLAGPHASGGDWLLAHGGATFRVGAAARPIWQPATSTQSSVTCIATIGRTDYDAALDVTRVSLIAPLDTPFDPQACRVCANVMRATQGETVSGEMLGGGSDDVALHRAPLTYAAVAGATPRPALLEVLVDGQADRRGGGVGGGAGARWAEVPFLALAGPADRVYELRHDDSGRAWLRFGDGRHGARLPAGTDTLAASYRTGAGAAGNVAGGALTVLRKRPPGIRSVTNPLAAVGGTEREGIAAFRARAPARFRHLDRIVTLADYASFAASYPGIGAADARLVRDDGQRIVLAALTAAGEPISQAVALREALRTAILDRRADDIPLAIVDPLPIAFRIALDLHLAEGAIPERVSADVRAALGATFARPRTIGLGVDRRALLDIVRHVPGVAGVTLTAFHLAGADDTGDPRRAAPPPPARLVAGPGAILHLDPLGGIALTVRP